MTRKQIKQFAKVSYTDKNLAIEKVETFAQKMTRSDLKQYIKELRSLERKNNVIVSLPYQPTEAEKELLTKSFPDKHIIYNIKPELLAGVKLEEDDMVYDMNLKDSLEKIVSHISENI